MYQFVDLQMMFVNMLATLFLFIGLFRIACQFAKVPHIKTSQSIRSIANKQRGKTKFKDVWYNDLCNFIAKFIYINKTKKIKLQEKLNIAGIIESPETFTAGSVVKAMIALLFVIPAYLLFPLAIPVVIILAILFYFQKQQQIEEIVKAKRHEIEMDLPRFVYSIEREIDHNHDVLSILEYHKSNFSQTFSKEIEITIADMRSGNYEGALQRLEGRVGSTSLSDVVRGLIQMVRGDDTHIYWETLSLRFSELQKQELRNQANKIPGKIKKLSLFLLACLSATYFVVLAMSAIDGVKSLF